MRLAKPPGVRSCKEGGKWELCRDSRGALHLMTEVASLEVALGPHIQSVVKAELYQKMKRAEAGALLYGSGPEFDVEHMAATADVLELRLLDRTGEVGAEEAEETFHLRLFFSEPDEVPKTLAGLGLLWKRPGPVGLDDQTLAAQTASRRLHEHYHPIS